MGLRASATIGAIRSLAALPTPPKGAIHVERAGLGQATAGHGKCGPFTPLIGHLHERAGCVNPQGLFNRQHTMPQASRHIPAAKRVMPPQLSQAVVAELVALYQQGEMDALVERARKILAREPASVFAWNALGKAHLAKGRHAAAIDAFKRLLKLAPAHAEANNDLGMAELALGQLDAAEGHFRAALSLQPGLAAAHSNMGAALRQRGAMPEAEASYRQALALQPGVAATHNSLANLLRDMGRLQEAQAAYQQALVLQPSYFEAWINLGLLCVEQQRWDEARNAYLHAINAQPNSALAHHCLGNLLVQLMQDDAVAETLLERAAALDSTFVEPHVALGNLRLRQGRHEASQQAFGRAQQMRPVATRLAVKRPADFQVLLLDAPGVGSTPVDHLLSRASYDSHFYCVMQGPSEHLDLLRGHADVVVNLIADADNGSDLLPWVDDILQALPCPVVNAPVHIRRSDRQSVASRLAGLDHCRVPLTRQFAQSALAEVGACEDSLASFAGDLLVRVAGRHGGEEMQLANTREQVVDFARAHAQDVLYVTEYVDYRSSDAYFRKYRLICVDGEVFPYHLAIHQDWLVHYFRTGMSEHAWMRQEEERFLREPDRVFNAQQWQALQGIARTLELDYCGIDCGIDAQGQLVLFEANATMLVHDEKTDLFAYKNPAVAAIKSAFDRMLAKRAKQGR